MPTSGYALLNDANVQAVISQRTAHQELSFFLPGLKDF